ncbi:hypothetical protein FDECE_16662 [Fusarium decemcellulare]|nr:hypothetical protein FDECE_16662 [Fusarium decemcellulare]
MPINVALPIKNQVEYIRKALLAGKHVLSEKPAGENIEDATNLIKWYRTEIKGSSWCVAENWRFLESYKYAAEHIKSLGRVLTFYGKQHSLVVPEGKFYQTEWRKNPTHQGGFLLDGGVHYIAGIRQLLAAQDGNQITQVSAFTTLLRDYLPPVDTAHAIFKTQSGATGSFQISVGSSSTTDEWTVECERGWVNINGHGGGSEVTVSKDGQVTTETIENEKTGVPPEIRAWGEALVAGRVNKEQEPEAALADLELIELMLKSGDNQGAAMDCVHQDV